MGYKKFSLSVKSATVFSAISHQYWWWPGPYFLIHPSSFHVLFQWPLKPRSPKGLCSLGLQAGSPDMPSLRDIIVVVELQVFGVQGGGVLERVFNERGRGLRWDGRSGVIRLFHGGIFNFNGDSEAFFEWSHTPHLQLHDLEIWNHSVVNVHAWSEALKEDCMENWCSWVPEDVTQPCIEIWTIEKTAMPDKILRVDTGLKDA